MKNILIIAGEASSDLHAAALIKDILLLEKDIRFFGLGGDKMQEAGVELMDNVVKHAFIGPTGLLKHYSVLKKIYDRLCARLKDSPPDCAILIDYAEFNLRVAKVLRSLGVPVIYYISPQVWAWGLWRIKTIEKLISKMLVFFKFEEELYKKHGVDAVWIGHPLLDIVKTGRPKELVRKDLKIAGNEKVVGILPGSREAEIKTILPIMLDSCGLLPEEKGRKVRLVLPLAPTVDEQHIRDIIGKSGLDVLVTKNMTYDTVSICDFALVCSGTATLETMLLGVPMAILYKTNALTYFITRNLIKLPWNYINGSSAKKISQRSPPKCWQISIS